MLKPVSKDHTWYLGNVDIIHRFSLYRGCFWLRYEEMGPYNIGYNEQVVCIYRDSAIADFMIILIKTCKHY